MPDPTIQQQQTLLTNSLITPLLQKAKTLIDTYSEMILTYLPMYDTFKLFYLFQWFITHILDSSNFTHTTNIFTSNQEFLIGIVLVAMQTIALVLSVLFIRIAMFIDGKTKVTVAYAWVRGFTSVHLYIVFNYFHYIQTS